MQRYQRVEVLGSGSYGSAVLVRERGPGAQFRVLKEIDLSRIPKKAQQEAETEAKVLRSLSHPNIVCFVDTFMEASKLCIIMEFADGGDLSASVKKRRDEGRHHSEEEALRIFAQCCLALQHVHAKHILHRDLKCQNIFLMKDGTVKMGDFGIAKVLDCTAAEAKTVIGTPIYLAPEVCHSQPYGIKADIWSLGVVLYEILALQPPFQGDNLPALIVKIVTGEPKPLPADLYAGEVRAIVGWMLQKRAEDRPTIDAVLARPIVRQRAAPFCGGCVDTKSVDGYAEAHTDVNRRCPLPRAPAAPQRSVSTPSSGQQLAPRPRSVSTPDGSAPACHALDVAEEFRRNREFAAQAKARAEADRFSWPTHSQNDEPAAHSRGPSRRPSWERSSRKAAEDAHLQALQEAAAQARRDRQQVQQRMQELDRVDRGSAGNDSAALDRQRAQSVENGSRLSGLAAKRDAEEAHLNALQEAAAQARRDRRQIQQKMHDLEHSPRRAGAESCGSSARGDVSSARASAVSARKNAEEEHLRALKEASAQAFRDRKALQQKMKGQEDELRIADSRSRSPEASRGFGKSEDSPDAGRARSSSAVAKKHAEDEHVQALREAAAEAFRDRKMLQQRMKEQDHEPDMSGRRSRSPTVDSGRCDREVPNVVLRHSAEEQRLKALAEAREQAARDRKALQQRMQDLEGDILERAVAVQASSSRPRSLQPPVPVPESESASGVDLKDFNKTQILRSDASGCGSSGRASPLRFVGGLLSGCSAACGSGSLSRSRQSSTDRSGSASWQKPSSTDRSGSTSWQKPLSARLSSGAELAAPLYITKRDTPIGTVLREEASLSARLLSGDGGRTSPSVARATAPSHADVRVASGRDAVVPSAVAADAEYETPRFGETLATTLKAVTKHDALPSSSLDGGGVGIMASKPSEPARRGLPPKCSEPTTESVPCCQLPRSPDPVVDNVRCGLPPRSPEPVRCGLPPRSPEVVRCGLPPRSPDTMARKTPPYAARHQDGGTSSLGSLTYSDFTGSLSAMTTIVAGAP